MFGETHSPSHEAFSSKKIADQLRTGYDAEVEHGAARPETSPIKQLERGDFAYDELGSPGYIEPGHSPEMLRAVIDSYFQAQPRNARLARHRHDQLTARDSQRHTEVPRATIVVPTAIHNEDAATLLDTLSEIAAQRGVEQDEIVLYGNLPSALGEAEKNQARTMFDEVIAQVRQSSPQLNIRSVAVEYDEDKLGIGRVRHDYMDLIAWDGAQRGFGIDHPVIMLDADTKQMTKDAFEQLAAVLTAPDADIIVAHTETHYLFDEDSQAQSLAGLPDARRLAMLQEIRRRQFLRTESREKAEALDRDINEVYNQGHYDEEWGMAVALGPCMLVGSYDEQGILDESRYLMQRLYDADGSIYDLMHHAKPDIAGGELYNGAYYLVGTTVRGSGRRPEQRLREWVAGGVNNTQYADHVEKHIQSVHQYQDFSHTDSLRTANTSAEPEFKDVAQAKLIVGSVLKPDEVPNIEGDPTPMPDPTALLRRLDLPSPHDET